MPTSGARTSIRRAPEPGPAGCLRRKAPIPPIAPGKRVTTSMSPMMALRDGRVVYALGLPGGRKIFPSAWQALINLIDHGMTLQEAVEAPRIWTEGNALEVEQAIPEGVRAKLRA